MAVAKYESPFTVETTGDTTGEKWKGLFKVKTRLSHRDQLNRDRVRREMIGNNPDAASERARATADVFSQLSIRLIDAPSWWVNADNGLDLADENVVIEVFQAALKAEQDETAKALKKGSDARKDLKTDSPE